MIQTIQGIPVYRAILADNEEGMERISLVDFPAVESDFLALAKQDKRPMSFAVENEEKRIIRGVVMRADFPIYRVGVSGYEYYIVFEKDTIREMAQKYLKESRQNEVNLQHEDGSEVEGVEMVQWFIKDSENGISPKGFEDISEGSLFAEFKVENDDVWNAVKSGEFKGFSLEGLFSHEVMKMNAEREEIINLLNNIDMTKIDRIKEALGKVLVEQEEQNEQKFGAVGTDKGVLHWEGDEDLVAGMEVWHEDENGERVTPEDGDYTTEDKKVIKVEGGKVIEIVDPVAEVDEGAEEQQEEQAAEETPEVVEETPAEENDHRERIERMEREIDELRARVDELTELLGTITEKMSKMSMALPAKQEVKKEESKLNKGIERARAMAQGLKRK